MAKNKTRLDVALVEQGFAESREKAKAIIMSGIVYVNNQKSDKAGKDVKDDDVIEVRGKTLKYVSRGGLKLEKAMECFPITLEEKICMDVGASTGGFTDCMLMNGAVKVYSVDVGYGQLAWKLRTDDRVVNLERTNFRYVTDEQIKDKIDFSSVDVSVDDSSVDVDSSLEDSVLSDDESLPASLELSVDVDSEAPSEAYTGVIAIAKAKPAVINVLIIFFFIKIPPFQVYFNLCYLDYFFLCLTVIV